MTKYEKQYVQFLSTILSNYTQERLTYPITVSDRYKLSVSQAMKHLLYVAAVDMAKEGRYGEEFLSLSTLEQQEILEAYPEEGIYQVEIYYEDTPYPLRTRHQTRMEAIDTMKTYNIQRRIAYQIREEKACPNSETH